MIEKKQQIKINECNSNVNAELTQQLMQRNQKKTPLLKPW